MSVTTLPPRRDVASVGPVFQPQSFGELVKFAEMICNSDLMPRDYKGKPGNIVLAVQMGSEVGLSPMAAIQGIAVINGRPAIWGDAMMGLVRQSPLCENITETIQGEGDARTAVCVAKRRNADPVRSEFSIGDAKKAGLFGKTGPWTQYPDRMLKQRARGFALRDAFADILKGLKTVEEIRDYPPAHREPPHRGPEIDAAADPQPVDAVLSGDTIPALDPAPAGSMREYAQQHVAQKPKPTPMQWFTARIASLEQRQQCASLLDEGTKARALFDQQSEADQATIRDMLAERLGEFLSGPSLALDSNEGEAE